MRTYGQFCPAARALDTIGSRWMILIIRELLLGPKRYSDLIAGLPGVGPNVLAERLKDLRDAGIVRQSKLPPPGVAVVYELTDLGEGVRPVVDALNKWGMQLLGTPQRGDRFQLGWLLGCLRASFRPDLAPGVTESYEFRVENDVFHVRVVDGDVDVRHGPAPSPACVLEADLTSFMAVGARLLAPEAAEAQGLVRVTGSRDAAARVITLLGPHLEATAGRYGIIGAVGARFQPDATRNVLESYEFRIDDLVFHADVDHGSMQMDIGPAAAPAATLCTDLGTLLGLGAGTVNMADAMAAGAVDARGNPESGLRMAAAFGVPVTEATPSGQDTAGPPARR
jgi:DNA-binding HxlR family transcriptional regulator/putative sterol carrier protein